MREARRHKRAVRTAFDRAATSYDAAAAVQREACMHLDAFMSAHPITREVHRVIDAGCGTGHALPRLIERFPAALQLALDFSPAMLRIACTANVNSVPLCADIEHLPLADMSVDAIWSSLAVQWCAPPSVLAEIARVLTPGGMAWIATLGPRTLHELRAAFASIDDAEHVIRFSPASTWQGQAPAAGLAVVATETYEIAALGPDLRGLLRDIKAIGAHTVGAGRRRKPLGRQAWLTLQAAYEPLRRADGQLPATYDLILIAVRKPA